jgi:hypothetical protein
MPSLPFPGVFGKFLQNTGQRYLTQFQRNLGPAARIGLGIEQRGTPAITAAARPIPGGVRATAAGVRALPGIKTAAGVGTTATIAALQDSRDPITENAKNLSLLGGPITAIGVNLGIPAIQQWDKFRASPTASLFADRFRQQTDRLRTGDIQGFAKNLYPGQPGPILQDASSNLPVNATAAGLRQASDAYARSAGLPTRSEGKVGQVTAPITSPNTTVQNGSASDGVSDEYRAQLSAWENKRNAAAGAFKSFQPGSGPMPAAATEAGQSGQELWAKLYPELAKPGGAVGTYNPLMQARGDVPSMADLWSGMRSIQAPTAGPGRTSEDVTDEAMAKARAEGRYFEPSGTMGGFAPAADPATQQRMQQFGTAMQAQKGTEETSAAQRSQDFVNRFKLGSLNPGSYNFPGYDANAMMNAPSALFK